MRSRHAALALALAFCLPRPGLGLEPSEVFALSEPSIVVVLASDAKGEKSSLGSGVIAAPLEILTSCKVVEAAADIVVTQGNTLRKAKLRFQDSERDLCQLQIEEPLPAGKPVAARVSSKDLKVGQTVYAISSPRGMERSIGRGMVSSLREVTGGARLIQTDTAAAGGSIGGGLFDQEARLVGIITPQFRQGEAASFAIPVEWIADLAKRNPDRMTASADSPASTAAAQTADRAPKDNRWHPAKGDRWRYRVIDGKRPVGTISIAVLESDGGRVRERITKDGSPGFSVEREISPEFSTRSFLPVVMLPGGYQLVELAGYFPPGSDLKPGSRLGDLPGSVNIPMAGTRDVVWSTRVLKAERVRVPAGEFDAFMVEATTSVNMHYGFVKVICHVWYSAAAQRAVKIEIATNSRISVSSTLESFEFAGFDAAK